MQLARAIVTISDQVDFKARSVTRNQGKHIRPKLAE